MSLLTFKSDPRIKDAARRKRTTTGVAGFTDTEVKLIAHIASGLTNKEIATMMGMKASTVETYRCRMVQRLGFKNSMEAVAFAIRNGVIN